MRTLGRIPAPATAPLPAGTLRRSDQEAFGRLLAELDGTRTVLVTGDRERKRAAAAGLAAAAAAAGTRTALLECDLAEPTLAAALGLAAAPGLAEYLRGEAEAGGILRTLVLAGPGSAQACEPLVCVVAGRPAADGEALVASDGLRQAVAGLRDVYELVVVEGPAASDGSLAAVAQHVDATVLCLRSGEDAPDLPLPLTGVVFEG